MHWIVAKACDPRSPLAYRTSTTNKAKRAKKFRCEENRYCEADDLVIDPIPVLTSKAGRIGHRLVFGAVVCTLPSGPWACSGSKFIVSRAGEAYAADPGGPNRNSGQWQDLSYLLLASMRSSAGKAHAQEFYRTYIVWLPAVMSLTTVVFALIISAASRGRSFDEGASIAREKRDGVRTQNAHFAFRAFARTLGR